MASSRTSAPISTVRFCIFSCTEVYRNITKVDENKDKKIDERTNTTTEKIIQNELHKGTFDEEDPAISVPGRKAGACRWLLSHYRLVEADAEKRLAAQLGSYANKEGPGVFGFHS